MLPQSDHTLLTLVQDFFQIRTFVVVILLFAVVYSDYCWQNTELMKLLVTIILSRLQAVTK